MNSQLLFILVIAMVAGFILFRLYSVLGRRTGNERPPQERFRLTAPGQKPADNVVALPDRTQRTPEAVPADPVARGLMDIKLADRSFETDHFIAGARHAYELIVVAFASGDRNTLRPLLSNEVYAAFDGVIKGRAERKEKVSFTFVGFKDATITHAEMKGRVADITLTFQAQFISATTDATGAVIEGDPKSVRSVSDIWTFDRDTRASDPNWTLVATHGEA
ncbi:MAG TPA: Tim44/TimA family putative adaptor protein [Rhizomicrobium sp.]|nr:Tim44/TimA family putative adaptor protein [Rhizomicrobium sp.]